MRRVRCSTHLGQRLEARALLAEAHGRAVVQLHALGAQVHLAHAARRQGKEGGRKGCRGETASARRVDASAAATARGTAWHAPVAEAIAAPGRAGLDALAAAGDLARHGAANRGHTAPHGGGICAGAGWGSRFAAAAGLPLRLRGAIFLIPRRGAAVTPVQRNLARRERRRQHAASAPLHPLSVARRGRAAGAQLRRRAGRSVSAGNDPSAAGAGGRWDQEPRKLVSRHARSAAGAALRRGLRPGGQGAARAGRRQRRRRVTLAPPKASPKAARSRAPKGPRARTKVLGFHSYCSGSQACAAGTPPRTKAAVLALSSWKFPAAGGAGATLSTAIGCRPSSKPSMSPGACDMAAQRGERAGS